MPQPTPMALNTLWSRAAGELKSVNYMTSVNYLTTSPLPYCRLYEKLILLVTKCEVYSVRATCFSALGLVAGTQAGANLLFKLSKFWVQNWECVRNDLN